MSFLKILMICMSWWEFSVLKQALLCAWIHSFGLRPGLKLWNWFWCLRGRGRNYAEVAKLNIANFCIIVFSSFQLSYYVFTIYVPIFMTVCNSFMSFLLDNKFAPARVMFTITIIFAMSTVAYPKVIMNTLKLRLFLIEHIFTILSMPIENYKSYLTYFWNT